MLHLQLSLLLEIRLHCVQQGVLVGVQVMIKVLVIVHRINKIQMVRNRVRYFYFSGENDDVGCINSYSYLKHEFKQAEKKNKTIIVVYNSLRRESDWLPSYMKNYEDSARPFWTTNYRGDKVGDYSYIKEVLGF